MKRSTLPCDELFQLEQRIARRADELDRVHGVDFARTLEHWRQAEQEVWNDVLEPDGFSPLAGAA